MRMGPVELRMMRGWPLKRQNTVPARAVPRKLSITPWGEAAFKHNAVGTGRDPLERGSVQTQRSGNRTGPPADVQH